MSKNIAKYTDRLRIPSAHWSPPLPGDRSSIPRSVPISIDRTVPTCTHFREPVLEQFMYFYKDRATGFRRNKGLGPPTTFQKPRPPTQFLPRCQLNFLVPMNGPLVCTAKAHRVIMAISPRQVASSIFYYYYRMAVSYLGVVTDSQIC